MGKQLILLIFISFLFTNCTQTQNPKSLELKPIVDISETPVYKMVTQETEGQIVYKEKYKYIDDISMNSIRYQSDGLSVTGLMVKPKKPGKYPCIIYNRGGNRDFGKLLVYHAVVTLGELASKGYVVIASNYRGNGGSEGQEEFGGSDVNDVINLIDALDEIEDANTDKIGMYGWSRGGMMTYIALTQTDKIDAAVVGAGRSDLTVIDRPQMESRVYAELMPNYAANKTEELKKRSAIHLIDKFPKNVPILLLHGSSDWRVKPINSLNLALKFEEYKIPYRLKIFEGSDHGIREFKDEANEEVFSWFERFLKSGEPLPDVEDHGR